MEQNSVSTLSSEGNKNYLVALGLADRVCSVEEFNNKFEGQFVVAKPTGTRSNMVKLFGPKNLNVRVNDKKDVKGLFNKKDEIFVQRFFMPFLKNIDGIGEFRTIYRMFFFYEPGSGKYIPIAGLATARPRKIFESQKNGFQIHGTPDAVFWPANFA